MMIVFVRRGDSLINKGVFVFKKNRINCFRRRRNNFIKTLELLKQELKIILIIVILLRYTE